MTFDWGFVYSLLPKFGAALGVTVQATLAGMVLALILGLIWAIARRSKNRALAIAVGFLVEFIRSTPLLVQLYFLFYVLPLWGPSLTPLETGILALGLHYSAYTAEVYRAGINGVPRAQWEAALALNLGRTVTWKSVILPQAVVPILPALGNYLVALFKETPLLSAITLLELLHTAKLIGADTFRYLEPLTLVGVFFLALSLIASTLIRKLENACDRFRQG
ncbi:MAG: ectoine/hydroxyectoine ABC transporter permease subunit EhuD [Nitrospinaceae bacterium]|nr:MAG: ectoine/hydroxyectoine ABC transporter permease subunit EhuD [Nitrospinaceae bacterium]